MRLPETGRDGEIFQGMVTSLVGGHGEDRSPEGDREAVHTKDTDSVRRKLGGQAAVGESHTGWV